MGWHFINGPCIVCEIRFSFNADYVPSFNGHPICRSCMTLVNQQRASQGLDPIYINPAAYQPGEGF